MSLITSAEVVSYTKGALRVMQNRLVLCVVPLLALV